MRPIALPANQPRDRFYAGGTRISAFRQDRDAPPHTPEDWVASVTTVRGEPAAGLTTLPDGRLLIDAIAADPVGWLGAEHLADFGCDTRLLVKLLDAGQRLPVHAHPDDAFAEHHVGTAHGKAEAWYILTPGTVHLGLTEDVDADVLRHIVDTQDIPSILGRMHGVTVQPGDTVLVPPGVLHAIGEGILLVEVQQPEDLSILLEWEGFTLDGRRDGHLGLGFDVALKAVEQRARTRAEVDALIRRAPSGAPLLPAIADPWFRLDLVDAHGPDLAPGFGVLIILEGHLVLRSDDGDVSAPAGSTVVVPAGAGAVRTGGSGRALLCRPPAPRG